MDESLKNGTAAILTLVLIIVFFVLITKFIYTPGFVKVQDDIDDDSIPEVIKIKRALSPVEVLAFDGKDYRPTKVTVPGSEVTITFDKMIHADSLGCITIEKGKTTKNLFVFNDKPDKKSEYKELSLLELSEILPNPTGLGETLTLSNLEPDTYYRITLTDKNGNSLCFRSLTDRPIYDGHRLIKFKTE